ncbi:MAG: biotin/lipoyl-containing protein [Holophagaceae bacterium]
MIVRTPWSGQVVEVRVRLGAEVDEDESLVLIENKSMEGVPETVYAPIAGVVLEIHVEEGDILQVDDELVTLEGEESDEDA